MNNRIRELILQSGTTGNHQVWFTRPEVEKLAELIIRECTNMLPEDSVRSKEGVHMFYVIREHFGISGIGR